MVHLHQPPNKPILESQINLVTMNIRLQYYRGGPITIHRHAWTYQLTNVNILQIIGLLTSRVTSCNTAKCKISLILNLCSILAFFVILINNSHDMIKIARQTSTVMYCIDAIWSDKTFRNSSIHWHISNIMYDLMMNWPVKFVLILFEWFPLPYFFYLVFSCLNKLPWRKVPVKVEYVTCALPTTIVLPKTRGEG